VRLQALGTFTLEPSLSRITRQGGKRTLKVSATLAKNVSVSATNKNLLDFVKTLDFPEGYDSKTGGVNEENNKSVKSILLAMILSSFLIGGTMVLQLGSYRKAMIVLLVIPLAVSGVFLFFAILKIPLSFPALIGVLALFGIVVNNSIIMVDKINKNLEAGMKVSKAVSDGAASRLEPILLTAMTTIVGLIPITLADPIWRGLGGAIIAGLLLSGFMKLFFIPIVYHAWFSEKNSGSTPV
jgi:multidrug efflux pump subunit AcrB